MSGTLVSLVFESTLPAWLKPYAAALASFANDDGSRVFPSVARVARMVGRSSRQARRAVTELRRRRVLVPVAAPGRHRATRYHFNEAALAFAGDGEQMPLLFGIPTFPQRKPVKAGLNSGFPQRPQVSTGHACPPMEDTGVRRSVNGSVMYSTYTRARASAKKVGTR